MYSIEKIDQILIISFEDKETQTLCMSGATSYYEDPKYYKQYIYKYNLIGNPNYQSNSNEGHNMSLRKLIKYFELSKRNNDLLYEEKELYKELKKYKDFKYVITKCEEDECTLEHEMKHCEYYFNKKYRKYVKSIWEDLDKELKNIIIKYLESYNEKLYIDEFQAYITTEPLIFLMENKKQKNKKKVEKVKKDLINLSKLINNWLKKYS